jgi:hypothetical protein
MKTLIAATAAVLALGITGSGIAQTNTQAPRATTMPPQSTLSDTAVPESQVKQAQQQLKSGGLYKGPVDGKWARIPSRRSSNSSSSTACRRPARSMNKRSQRSRATRAGLAPRERLPGSLQTPDADGGNRNALIVAGAHPRSAADLAERRAGREEHPIAARPEPLF